MGLRATRRALDPVWHAALTRRSQEDTPLSNLYLAVCYLTYSDLRLTRKVAHNYKFWCLKGRHLHQDPRRVTAMVILEALFYLAYSKADVYECAHFAGISGSFLYDVCGELFCDIMQLVEEVPDTIKDQTIVDLWVKYGRIAFGKGGTQSAVR